MDRQHEEGQKGYCYLNSDLRQCCCQCIYHKPDYLHCNRVETRGKHNDCVCSIQKGWICEPPDFDGRRYSDWPKHSIGCEMYLTQEQYEKYQKPYNQFLETRETLINIYFWANLLNTRINEKDPKNIAFAKKKLERVLKEFKDFLG